MYISPDNFIIRILLGNNLNHKIARFPFNCLISEPCQSQVQSFEDAARNSDLLGNFFLQCSHSSTLQTGFYNFAQSIAGFALILLIGCLLLIFVGFIAGALTFGASFVATTRFLTTSVASLTIFVPRKSDFLFAAVQKVFQGEFEVNLHVTTFNLTATSTTLLFHILYIFHRKEVIKLLQHLFIASDILIVFASETKAKWVKSVRISSLFCILLVIGSHSCCVVKGALLFIPERFVGFVNF